MIKLKMKVLKKWSPIILLSALALSNTSFLVSENSSPHSGNLSFASRIPSIKANKKDFDLCGDSKDMTNNEKVDLLKLFIKTADATAEASERTSVHSKDTNLAFAESFYANLTELEKMGFNQVELMNGGDEALSFCLPKLIDEAMGKGVIYSTHDQQLSRLTNYLGHQGVSNPELLARNLLFIQEKIKR